MVNTIIITPFWSASTDAYSRRDFTWIRNISNKLNQIWLGLSILGLILLALSSFAYKIWMGDAIEANFVILGLTLVYFIFYMRYGSYGYILNGLGKVRLQLVITSIMAIFYLPLAYTLSKNYGLVGILLAMISVMLVNSTWSRIQFHKIIAGNAQGIWNK
jgi:O-antigen/teichoic acid export membrane protein